MFGESESPYEYSEIEGNFYMVSVADIAKIKAFVSEEDESGTKILV